MKDIHIIHIIYIFTERPSLTLRAFLPDPEARSYAEVTELISRVEVEGEAVALEEGGETVALEVLSGGDVSELDKLTVEDVVLALFAAF